MLTLHSGKRNTKAWSTEEFHHGRKARANLAFWWDHSWFLSSFGRRGVIAWVPGGFSKGKSKHSTWNCFVAANGAVNSRITLGAIWFLGKKKNVHTLSSERAVFFPTFWRYEWKPLRSENERDIKCKDWSRKDIAFRRMILATQEVYHAFKCKGG